MWKDIAFAAAVLLAACAVCLYLASRPGPASFHAPLSDLAAVDGMFEPFGDDGGAVGRLAEPVVARVTLYGADAETADTRLVEIRRGAWVLPEQMFDKPY